MIVKNKPLRFWVIVYILYVALIFGQSAVPASGSSAESGFLLGLAQSVLSALHIPSAWLTEHLLRKMAHFTEYAIMGVLLRIMTGKMQERLSLAFRMALPVFIPFLDETIQLFVPGRSGQVSDMWIDFAGVLTGLLLQRVFSKERRK